MARTKPTYIYNKIRFTKLQRPKVQSPRDIRANHRAEKKEAGFPKVNRHRASRQETDRERRYRIRNEKKEAGILKEKEAEATKKRAEGMRYNHYSDGVMLPASGFDVPVYRPHPRFQHNLRVPRPMIQVKSEFLTV